MDENIPLTSSQDASNGYRLTLAPTRELRDLVVCLRVQDGRPWLIAWGETGVLPRSRSREHWAELETDVRDIKDLSAQLLADWKAFVDYQPADRAAGIRPYATGADLSSRPPGEVQRRVAELVRAGSHLLDTLLSGHNPNLLRLRAFLATALHRRDLRIRFDSDLDLPWPLLAVGEQAPPISGPPPAPAPYASLTVPYDVQVSSVASPPTTPGTPGGGPANGPGTTAASAGGTTAPTTPSELARLFDLFLGHRHLIETASGAYETDFYYAASRARPISSANIDEALRRASRVPEAQKVAAEVHKLLDDQTELTERTHSDTLLNDLDAAHFDEDLMYFFCHGAVLRDGDATWQAFQLTDARAVHAGRIDSIRKRYTEANRSRGEFVPFHPMVVLNVCYAGSPMTGRFASLAGSFIQHGAQGVLAPAIAVPQLFGAEFALRFLTRYLVDRSAAGEAVRDTVRWFAAEYHNPLGLIYGLHCGLDSRLPPAAPDEGATAP
ncbi:CHAT domain-containing protein [Streptomyces sp. 796.1]|uniref:CHAT domain-containing protein n=1 Tax=Streptomyces sp. 796.1 TaxID=3163029 RepID=UPI0039C91872